MTQTPLSRSKGQRSRSPGPFTHRGLNAAGSCSGECVNVLGVGNYCYVAVCSAALSASAPTEGGEGRKHLAYRGVARLQLFTIKSTVSETGTVAGYESGVTSPQQPPKISLVPALIWKIFSQLLCSVYPLSRYANFYSLIYLLFEQHVYKHNSDVRKCVISATLKNCKLHN